MIAAISLSFRDTQLQIRPKVLFKHPERQIYTAIRYRMRASMENSGGHLDDRDLTGSSPART